MPGAGACGLSAVRVALDSAELPRAATAKRCSTELQKEYFALLDFAPDTYLFSFRNWHFGQDSLLAYTWTYDRTGDDPHDGSWGEAPHGYVNIVKLGLHDGMIIAGDAVHLDSMEGYEKGYYTNECSQGQFSPHGSFLAVPLELYSRAVADPHVEYQFDEEYPEDEFECSIVLVVKVDIVTLQHVVKMVDNSTGAMSFAVWSWDESLLLFADYIVCVQDGSTLHLPHDMERGSNKLIYDTQAFHKTGEFLGFSTECWPEGNSAKITTAIIIDPACSQELFRVPDHSFGQFFEAQKSAVFLDEDNFTAQQATANRGTFKPPCLAEQRLLRLDWKTKASVPSQRQQHQSSQPLSRKQGTPSAMQLPP
ncbi:hypothetical protein WJX73_010939 [Symbiochloris irregularis]|uniref:Uncharacterized protein n=1 Tax=Symbiochloris irregularis TaxID=706552 RepID=A0AAW1PUA3_9CHLO